MGYLLIEILVYLLIASIIGFIVGWVVRGKSNEIIASQDSKDKVENKTSTEKASEEKVTSAQKSDDGKKASEEVTSVEKSEDTVKASTATSKAPAEESSSPVLLSEAREAGKDNLSLLKGIGPVLESKLNKLGIYHFDQIASWDKAQQAWIGSELLFPKKVEREEWVKQAEELLKK